MTPKVFKFRAALPRVIVSHIVGLSLLAANTGCGIIRKKAEPSADEMAIVGKPIPPEKAKEILNEVGSNFVYGPGLGEAAVNVGTIVVFPPYALYLVGNAILSFSGYEPVTVSSFLPDESGKKWSGAVDQVMSGPGRLVAAVAGKESRSREVSAAKMRSLVQSISAASYKPGGQVTSFRENSIP